MEDVRSGTFLSSYSWGKLTLLFQRKTSVSLAVAALIGHIIYIAIRKYLDYRADTEFGRQQQCQVVSELSYKWPLGIDRIKQLWQSNAEGRLLAFLCSIAKDYEPNNMASQFLLFGPRAFYVLHPTNVETVFSTNYTDFDFGVRAEIFGPLLGNGIFTQQGAKWRHSRELLRKQFVRTQYKNLDHFREHVDNLTAHLPNEGVIDLQPLFFNLTLDTTTALLLGKSVYSLRAGVDQAIENRIFSQSFTEAQEGLAKRFRIAPFHFLYNPPSFRRACSNVHRFVEQYIEERNLQNKSTETEDENYGFFDEVAKESGTTTDLRDQLMNVLLAGRDSTACCLSWTFRLLVRYPHAMDRLKKEIFAVMGDSDRPTREQIRNMPFLACVIKESLRLYPPVPLNNRTATNTTILPTGGGPDGASPILVRKGELLVVSSYVNSRFKTLYGEDASEFRPERWEDGSLTNIGWAFFPFSGGPRGCLGEDFAKMEVSYVVVRLLQIATFSLPPGEKVEPIGMEKQRLTLVLSSQDGCRVQVKRS